MNFPPTVKTYTLTLSVAQAAAAGLYAEQTRAYRFVTFAIALMHDHSRVELVSSNDGILIGRSRCFRTALLRAPLIVGSLANFSNFDFRPSAEFATDCVAVHESCISVIPLQGDLTVPSTR